MFRDNKSPDTQKEYTMPHSMMTKQNDIAAALKPVLAETYQLYILTQNIHWNITGPQFHSIHTLTEEQYTELATAIDEIAERIRALGTKAPGNFAAYQELGTIENCNEEASGAEMISALSAAHALIAKNIKSLINNAADSGDEVTADLLISRVSIHEKAQWMLKAMTS